jgi:hypothetical protein
MDDWQRRKIFEKAYALVDHDRREAEEREHARWRARHFDPVLGRIDLGEPTEVEPTPPPQPRQTSQLTDAQILRVVDDHIAKAFRENTVISPTQRQALGEAFALLRQQWQQDIDQKLGALKAEIETKNNRVELVRKGQRDRDVA